MSMIEAKDICFSWGTTHILKNVSMAAKDGRFIGLIGPNGSGKSTLLKCIYRVYEPSGGSIFLDGKDIKTISHRGTAKKLAVVEQHNQYDFDFSVMDIVMMGRSPHKTLLQRDSAEDVQLANDALEKVGMSDFKERPFASLSGGEQQRIILARALVQQTPLLILDEPTNHLDIKYQLSMLNTVKTLGKTVIAAFHDLNIAAMFCDEIYVLRNGEFYSHGTPEEVLTEEMIEDVYGVKANVLKDRDGQVYVIYKQ